MPFNMKPWEFLIIVALILLLFGAKRLPDAARGLGRSLRIFKAETKALHEDETTAGESDASGESAPSAITPGTANAAPAAEAPTTQPQADRAES